MIPISYHLIKEFEDWKTKIEEEICAIIPNCPEIETQMELYLLVTMESHESTGVCVSLKM